MNIKIRSAQYEDADFLSWLILTAGRAHVEKGIWDVILGESEEKCLDFLELLAVTESPHYFHYTCCVLAEVEGIPAAGLGGYDPSVSGNSALRQALPEVFQKLKMEPPFTDDEPPRILDCIPEPLEDTWIIDSVASTPEFRRKGIVNSLMEDILQKGRSKGFKRAQINIYIGNHAAQNLYEKHGFKIIDEIRDPYFEAEIGAPGMACMLRDI
jgi:ribosomal protein S18 acetylase RimI-like enzyme